MQMNIFLITSVPSQSIRAFSKNGIATRTFIARVRILCKFVEINLLYQSTEQYEEQTGIIAC